MCIWSLASWDQGLGGVWEEKNWPLWGNLQTVPVTILFLDHCFRPLIIFFWKNICKQICANIYDHLLPLLLLTTTQAGRVDRVNLIAHGQPRSTECLKASTVCMILRIIFARAQLNPSARHLRLLHCIRWESVNDGNLQRTSNVLLRGVKTWTFATTDLNGKFVWTYRKQILECGTCAHTDELPSFHYVKLD